MVNGMGGRQQPPEEGTTPKKVREKCPYGFSCANFMLLPGVIAQDCENLTTCKELTNADGVPWTEINQPTFDLVVYRLEEEQREQERTERWERERRRIRYIRRIQQHEAAVMLLQQRGNSQAFSDFDIKRQLPLIEESLAQLTQHLDNLNRGYIAPDEVEVHIYSVKHPPTGYFKRNFPDKTLEEIRSLQKIYYYHKLLSKIAQFEPVQDSDRKCKTIHCSHSDDARNIQARIGIERRNRLSKIRTRVTQAAIALQEAAELAQAESSYDDVLIQSLNAEPDA